MPRHPLIEAAPHFLQSLHGAMTSLPSADVDDNRSGQIIAGSVVLIVLPTVTVALRLVSRWMSGALFWWDDYTIIAALILSWATNILNLVAIPNGLGKHLLAVTLLHHGDMKVFFKLLYIFQLVYYFALGFVKYSIVLFQYRIFPIIHFRRILVGCNVFVTVWLITFIFVTVFLCIPVSDFWNTFGGARPRENTHCLHASRVFLIGGGINAATNFILLAMPIPLLWKLKTRVLQKLILTVIFTVGLTVCAVSIVRLVLLTRTDREDITWDYGIETLWTAAEPSIGVVSACLPSLRPLFAKLVMGRAYKPKLLSQSTHSSGIGHSWRRETSAKDAEANRSGSFNRIKDELHGGGVNYYPPWTNKFAAYGPDAAIGQDDDIEVLEPGDRRSVVPEKGIRVKTTVTVTEKVDWRYDLF